MSIVSRRCAYCTTRTPQFLVSLSHTASTASNLSDPPQQFIWINYLLPEELPPFATAAAYKWTDCFYLQLLVNSFVFRLVIIFHRRGKSEFPVLRAKLALQHHQRPVRQFRFAFNAHVQGYQNPHCPT